MKNSLSLPYTLLAILMVRGRILATDLLNGTRFRKAKIQLF
jgi:hypothetical protein